MKKKILVGAGVLALAAVGAILYFGRGASGDDSASEGVVARESRRLEEAAASRDGAKPARRKRLAGGRSAAADSRPADASEAAENAPDEVELSPEDQKRIDAIQVALDAENVDEVRKLAEAAINHPSAEVRQRAIEALQWFGSKTLDSMTPFLADADEDVKSTATDAIEQALSEMEDENAKLTYIESLFQIRGSCDEDTLAILAGQLKGLSNDAAVIDSAVRVIEANANPAAVKEMREVYEFITGEPYTTPDAAQQWRAENAETPELP